MLEVLRDIASSLMSFLIGIFKKEQGAEPNPLPAPSPIPSVNPPTPNPPSVNPSPVHGPQSPWWDKTFIETQVYGCTHSTWELHNPNHPTCDYWHDGRDYGLPCGTPIYSAYDNWVVIAVDDPAREAEFGPAALGLRDHTDPNKAKWQVWLLHMQDYKVKYGDVVKRGTLLGHSGTRGRSTGCHLHFQVIPRGGNYFSSVDPLPWIEGK